jgi:hypothetical protein
LVPITDAGIQIAAAKQLSETEAEAATGTDEGIEAETEAAEEIDIEIDEVGAEAAGETEVVNEEAGAEAVGVIAVGEAEAMSEVSEMADGGIAMMIVTIATVPRSQEMGWRLS